LGMYILGNSIIIKKEEKEYKYIRMKINMKEFGIIIRETVKEY